MAALSWIARPSLATTMEEILSGCVPQKDTR